MRTTLFAPMGLVLAACGGSTANPAVEQTAGGEAPAVCSVPGSPAGDLYADAARALAAQDVPRALALYEQACEQGNACACTERGEAYVRGVGGASDPRAARSHLERGCRGGDDWGCHAAALAIWAHAPQDAARARELFAQACENGVADACTELARFFVTGVGGEAAPAEAIALLDRACENGSRFGCYILGEAHAAGVGTPRDPERARELLTWACDEAGIPQACTAWANLLDEEPERRTEILRRGCEGGDPVACDAVDPDAARRGGEAPLVRIATSRPDPLAVADGATEVPFRATLEVPAAELGLRASCVGVVGTAPSAVLTIPEGANEIDLRVRALADTVLVVRDGRGHWFCNDDGEAGSYDAELEIDDPAAGELLVWAGALRAGSIEGTLHVQADVPSPTVALESLSAPRPETLAIPSRPMAHYQLRATTVPGVAGVLRLDGETIGQFTSEGGTVATSQVQCMLRPGRHLLEVAVLQRRGRARAVAGAGLVHLELHGFAEAGTPSDESRLFQLDWSPDAPARRLWQFTLGRRQGAAPTEACAAAAARPG